LHLQLRQFASAGVGRPYKLVCQAERLVDGTAVGSVKPEQVPNDEPLAGCDGATSTSALATQMHVSSCPRWT